MLHWEGCEVMLLLGTRVCIGWLRSILQQINDSQEENLFMPRPLFSDCFSFILLLGGCVYQRAKQLLIQGP